uniref:Uncharacterized protein n=1 Tax=Cyclopterus lumpus TaxID=8103 RepID=A0A8C2WQG1_CYCLU
MRPELGSKSSELGARLEEKRKSIEAQKRRIEAIFAKHRQRLGKTAFLQLKREQGEGGGEGYVILCMCGCRGRCIVKRRWPSVELCCWKNSRRELRS